MGLYHKKGHKIDLYPSNTTNNLTKLYQIFHKSPQKRLNFKFNLLNSSHVREHGCSFCSEACGWTHVSFLRGTKQKKKDTTTAFNVEVPFPSGIRAPLRHAFLTSAVFSAPFSTFTGCQSDAIAGYARHPL